MSTHKKSKPILVQISIPNCTSELKAWLEQDSEKHGRSLAAHVRAILEEYRDIHADRLGIRIAHFAPAGKAEL